MLKRILTLAVFVACSTLTRAATTENWVLIQDYDSGQTVYIGADCGGFTATYTAVWHLNFLVVDHYVVTGDTTNEPSWRLLLANLCNNYWDEEFDQYAELIQGSVVTYRRDYYTRITSQTFVNDAQSASRQSDEKITTAYMRRFKDRA